MPVAPTITFRRIRRSAQLEAAVLTHVARLERYVPSLIAVRVLVELPQRRHRSGNRCHVRIDLSVPGEDVIVTHDASVGAALRAASRPKSTKQDEIDPLHRHARVAIREAFEVARRRAQDYTRRRRGAVKTHAPSRA
jgi:ribosome-associated translation inhibitor RaiA